MDEALLTPVDGLVGRQIGKYLVQDKLGGGGMGAVYRARHASTGGLAALKVMRPQIADSQDAIKRFHLEAQNAAALHSMHTVRILDFGVEADLMYLVMEYLDGDSLDVALRDGPLPWRRAVGIARQVLESLWEAHQHERRIVHRDIKPPNIVLVRNDFGRDHVKVIDFGIARALDATGAGTRGAIGTPHAIAPEQWQGSGVDARTDLYAVGCVLYEMLSGRPPFTGRGDATPNERMMQLAAAHMSQAPASLVDKVAGIPPALAELVDQLLAKSPDDRPADARAAIIALDRCLAAPSGESAGWSPAQAADVTVNETELPTLGVGAEPEGEVVVRHTPTPVAAQPDGTSPVEDGPITAAPTLAGPITGEPATARPPTVPQPAPGSADAGRSRKWWTIAALLVAWFFLDSGGSEPFNVEFKHDVEGDRRIEVSGVEDPEAREAIEELAARGANWLQDFIERKQRENGRPVGLPMAATPGGDGEAPELVWRARLSAQDHVNQQGRALRKAHHVIAQDRVNFHRHRRRDEQDTADDRYRTKEGRRKLRRMLRRARIGRDVRERIAEGTPLIEVRIYAGGRAEVVLIDE